MRALHEMVRRWEKSGLEMLPAVSGEVISQFYQLDRVYSVTGGMADKSALDDKMFRLWQVDEVQAQLEEKEDWWQSIKTRLRGFICESDEGWEEYLVFADVGYGVSCFAVKRGEADSRVWMRLADDRRWDVVAQDVDEFFEKVKDGRCLRVLNFRERLLA